MPHVGWDLLYPDQALCDLVARVITQVGDVLGKVTSDLVLA